MARLYTGIISEAQILVIPVEQNLKEHFETLRKRLKKSDVLYESAMQQSRLTEDYLREKNKQAGLVNDYSTYIMVRLSKAAEYEAVDKVWEAARYFLKDPVNAVNVHMNLDTKDIMASKINVYRKMAEKWLDDNQSKMPLEGITTEETQWLIRRMAYRGTGDSPKMFYRNTNEEPWKPAAEEFDMEKEKIVRPYQRDIVNLFSGNITGEERRLKITTGFSTSYQTFLTLSWIPDEMDFPGREWIYELQEQNLRAEVCIHIKVLPHKSALNRLDSQKRGIDSQMEHILKANADIPEDLDTAREYANYMEQELKANKSPILETTVTICLAGRNAEELERKCSMVKEIYDDLNIIVERPLTDQLKLFMSFIPSVRNLMKDFVLRLTPVTLASGIVGVTRELGDRRGGYIGTIGEEEKPVFFSPELACLVNKSPAITLFGDLGTGKSFNANLLIYHLVLNGGYGLILDPKGERSHWESEFTVLRGLITVVTLGAGKGDRGKLDPYNIYPDNLTEANELALNVLSDLFAIDPRSDENTIIIEAQQKMGQIPGKNSMLKLAEILSKVPETDELYEVAQRMARHIRVQRGNGMAGLLIGDGTENAIKLDNRMNIIQLQNLKMPEPDQKKEDYTRDEILSGIIFGQVSAFVKKFALVKRTVPKAILVDESWFVSQSTQGRNMEDFISRMGRSLFTIIMYNGHSVTDLPTVGIKNSITYKFVFRSGNEEEAERLLNYIGLEITPENMAIIQNLPSGCCLFKDLYNRVGLLTFDAVFQDIMDLFSTTPSEEKDQSEEEQQYIEENLEPLEELDLEEDEEEPVTDPEEIEEEFDPDLNFDFSNDIDLFAREEL